MRSLENAYHRLPERLRYVFTTRRYTNTRLPLPLPLPLSGGTLFQKSSAGADNAIVLLETTATELLLQSCTGTRVTTSYINAI